MTLEKLHIAFNIELDKSNVSGYPSFLPEERDYFINTAITKFYKTKYSGYNAQLKGFQQNQKRSDDFRKVVKSTSLSVSTSDFTKYTANFPEDYWFMVGETARIKYASTTPGEYVYKNVDVYECTIENLDNRLNNSLSEHILNRGHARPLRVFVGDEILLYTDGEYSIDRYDISYICKPAEVNWYSTAQGYSNSTTELENVPDHAWDEIIKLAVKAAIENISDYRYQSYSQETQVVE